MILFAAGGLLLQYLADVEFAPLLGLFAGLLVANFVPPRRSGRSCDEEAGEPHE